MALVEEREKRGLTQSDVAKAIGVHRSVINRELRGQQNMTLSRVAELAHAMGRVPHFELVDQGTAREVNVQATTPVGENQYRYEPRVSMSVKNQATS